MSNSILQKFLLFVVPDKNNKFDLVQLASFIRVGWKWFNLKEVKSVVEGGAWQLVQVFTAQQCQLVRVLTWRWYSNRSGPIVVQETKFVRHRLVVGGSEA